MNILLLTDGITPFVTGGMQRHSYNLADYLTRAGHRVHLIHCIPEGTSLKSVFDVMGQRDGLSEHCLYFPAPGKFPGHYIRDSYRYSKVVLDSVKDILTDFDFVYAKGFTAWALLEERKKGLSCPHIGVNFHGYEMFQQDDGIRVQLEKFMLRKPVRRIVSMADVLFSYGGKVTDVMKKAGIPQAKIIEAPSGIAEDWIASGVTPLEGIVKFLFVGRNERRKGLSELYSAILMSPPELEMEIGIVGPIEGEQQLVHDKVKYYGLISDKDHLKKVLSAHHVLVTPSFSEGMPNVILEAMASGCGVLATNVGAVPALVTPQTGWLIDSPPNPYDIRDAMVEIVQSRDDLQQKRIAAHAHVQASFLWPEIIERLVDEIFARAEKVKV